MRRVPRVGIVIPAWNAASFITRTLESIRAQSLSDWVCCVVDDGSDDDTSEVAHRLAAEDTRITVLRQENAGASAARNHGFRHLDPGIPYVAFMDADDLWKPEALELLVRAAEAAPEHVGAHGVADFIDEHDQPFLPGAFADRYCRLRLGFDGKTISPWPRSQPTSFNVLLVNGVYPPGLVLIRRRCVEAVGGWEGSLWPVDDWDFLIRLSLLGDFSFVDEIIVGYRRHSSNASNNLQSHRHSAHVMRKRIHYYNYASPAQQALAQGFYRPYQLHRMREKHSELLTCLRAGKVVRSANLLLHLFGIGCRYVRGYPALGGPLSG